MTHAVRRTHKLRAAAILTATLVAGALAAPVAAQAANGSYDLRDGGVNVTVQGGVARVAHAGVTEEVPLSEPVIVTSGGQSTTNRLRVNTSGLGVDDVLTVRLSDARLRSGSSPVTLSGNGAGNLRIELLGENSADSSGDAGVAVLTPTTTTIDVPAGFGDGDGSLSASAINSAGIGAYTVLGRADDDDPDPSEDPATRLPGVHVFPDWHEAGKTAPGDSYEGEPEEYAGEGYGVTISGGTVTASSVYGAGIGGAEGVNGRNADHIIITGGHVTATSEHGAGIGGGNGGSWSMVDIAGGFVEAHSLYGEALGGGWTGGSRSGSEVWVDGGTVLAQSDSKPPFKHRSAYPVTIAGGSVQAFGVRGATALGALSAPVFPAVARLLPDTDGAQAALRTPAVSGYGTNDVVTTTMQAGTPGTNGTPGWVSPWLPAAESVELGVDRLDASGAVLGSATYSGEVVAGTGGHLRMPLPAPTVAEQERSTGDPVTITATLAIADVPAEVAPVRWAVLPAASEEAPAFQDSPVFPGLEPETDHLAFASVPINDWYDSPSEGAFTTIAADGDEGEGEGGEGEEGEGGEEGEEGEGEGSGEPEGEGGNPAPPAPPAPPACTTGSPDALCETGDSGPAAGLAMGGLLLLAGAGVTWAARSRKNALAR